MPAQNLDTGGPPYNLPALDPDPADLPSPRSLPETFREVLLLVDVHLLTYAAAAAVIGVP